MRARERRILPLLLPLLLLWGCAGREEAAPAPTEEPEESAKEIAEEIAEESVPVLTWGQYSTPADAQELQLAGEDISLHELRSLLEQMTAAPALVELGEQSYDAGELAPLCADYPLTRFVCAVELLLSAQPVSEAIASDKAASTAAVSFSVLFISIRPFIARKYGLCPYISSIRFFFVNRSIGK